MKIPKLPAISQKKDGRFRFDFNRRTYVARTRPEALRKRRQVYSDHCRAIAELDAALKRQRNVEIISMLNFDAEELLGFPLENLENPDALLELLQMSTQFESAIEAVWDRRTEIDRANAAQPIPVSGDLPGSIASNLDRHHSSFGIATSHDARGIRSNVPHDGEMLDGECTHCGQRVCCRSPVRKSA